MHGLWSSAKCMPRFSTRMSRISRLHRLWSSARCIVRFCMFRSRLCHSLDLLLAQSANLVASAFLILVVASQILNYLLPGSSYSRPTREPKLRYHAKIQETTTSRVRASTYAWGPCSSGDADKACKNTQANQLKLSNLTSL